jgi:response regulator RpfG family c-di-GMP phosphodiesterase
MDASAENRPTPVKAPMKLNGRILIVSDREDVVAELEPILRSGQHLALTVRDATEALETLEGGLVPDLIITDAGARAPEQTPAYLRRFSEINRVGEHMLVLDEDAQPHDRRETTLRRPFRPGMVQAAVEDAVQRIDRELVHLRAEVWREMERMRRGVREMRRDVVVALAATIAARDPYMHGHAERVAQLGRRVVLAMGLAPDDVELYETAALVHEIGKVAIPLDLLHKTDPLTPEELARLRDHARVGADILRTAASLRSVANAVEYQNVPAAELGNWLEVDSREYLVASILHVVDSYDAMTSARAYRGPLPRDYWERNLREGLGTRYHPGATQILLDLVAHD